MDNFNFDDYLKTYNATRTEAYFTSDEYKALELEADRLEQVFKDTVPELILIYGGTEEDYCMCEQCDKVFYDPEWKKNMLCDDCVLPYGRSEEDNVNNDVDDDVNNNQ